MQVSNPPTQIDGHRESTAGLFRPLNTSTNGEIDQIGIASGSLDAFTSNQTQSQVPLYTVPFRPYLLALLPLVLRATHEEIEELILTLKRALDCRLLQIISTTVLRRPLPCPPRAEGFIPQKQVHSEIFKITSDHLY